MTTETNQRPEVSVNSLTANTVEVIIELDAGTVRLVCEHSGILVEAKGNKIRIKP